MKSFNAIYEEVLNTSKNELEDLRKKLLIRVVSIIVIAACIVILGIKLQSLILLNIGLIGAIIFCIILLMGPQSSYKQEYKEKVVKKFIKDYDENLNYYPERGIRFCYLFRS